MNATFKYSSEHLAKNDFCQELEVEIEIYASEDDAYPESIKLYDEANNEIKLADLPANEQQDIEEHAQKLADNKQWDAFQDRIQSEADARYDFMKENE